MPSTTTPGVTPDSGSRPPTPWDPALRELLKRYPPSTLRAAQRLRAGDGGSENVRIFVLGVISRHLTHATGEPLRLGDDHRNLATDLGLDSLALLEMITVVEEVLGRSLPPDQLRRLHTVGDVVELIARQESLGFRPSPRDDQPDAA